MDYKTFFVNTIYIIYKVYLNLFICFKDIKKEELIFFLSFLMQCRHNTNTCKTTHQH